MRSLEEWTKYLEEQEQALKQAREEEIESAPAETHAEEIEREMPPFLSQPSIPASVPTAAVQAPPPSRPEKPAWPVEKPAAPVESVEAAVRLRKKLPRQLRGDGGQEVAQGSYEEFKETREELLQRLLDPEVSLEDAARILNVCPTTVRRYTNRGLLKHFRTPGNQRRFRLSDVLSFLEAHGPSL
jgi:excisionase family DNA binding protein